MTAWLPARRSDSTRSRSRERSTRAIPVKELGEPKMFLGMTTERKVCDEITVCQSGYSKTIVDQAGFENCHQTNTPTSMARLGFVSPFPPLDAKAHIFVRKIHGIVIYLLFTRCDMPWAVNQNCRYNHAPTQDTLTALKRIVRYLSRTLDFKLVVRSLRRISPSGLL